MSSQNHSPLERFNLQSNDPALAHDLFRSTFGDSRLNEPVVDGGGFSFSHAGVRGAHVSIARMHYSGTARIDVSQPTDSLIVATRVGGRLAVSGDGGSSRPAIGEPMLLRPRAEWSASMANLTVDLVVLEREVVDEATRSTFGVDAEDLRFSGTAPVSQAMGRYWRDVVAQFRRQVLADDEVAASPLVLSTAVRALAVVALVVFPHAALTRAAETASNGAAPSDTEPVEIRRALTYIHDRAGDDIGVDDIAAAARTSVRGLQNAFRRHRNTTPLEHLRRIRLGRAHDELRSADATHNITVAAVAARWGFSNPGRFSAEYRVVFGCSPSTTLRRSPTPSSTANPRLKRVTPSRGQHRDAMGDEPAGHRRRPLAMRPQSASPTRFEVPAEHPHRTPAGLSVTSTATAELGDVGLYVVRDGLY